MNPAPKPAFGIDLGTTCSAIGTLDGRHPRLIEIDGSTLVPSVVRFAKDGAPIVGTAALNQLALYADETLRSTKRQIGTDTTWTIHGQTITPRDVATAILRALCDGAEAATGQRPVDVVVTVPAWFSHSARSDTQTAAEAAGLNVVRLVNEPTAAALARDFTSEDERTYLVYDFGGGTFDASLIVQHGALVEVKASHGDTHLGGDDLDEALLAVVLDQLDGDAPNVAAAIRGGRAQRETALAAVREAKHALASDLTASVRAPFLADANGEALHLECELDREDLESALEPLLERTFACIDQVLLDGGLDASQVNDVLLVGGTTRAPGVRAALLSRYGWEGDASIPVQDAVGLGATVQAGIAAGHDVEATLIDVTPHALSVTAEMVSPSSSQRHLYAETITPRNVTLPCKHTHRFWTRGRFQQLVKSTVMQGSNPNPLRNVMLGEVLLDKIPPAPPHMDSRPIAIELAQSLSGVVSVRIIDELSGRSVDAAIALSGMESEEARQELIDSFEDSDLIPGDGTDPDPFCLQAFGDEPHRGAGPDEAPSEAAAAATPARIDDARSAFAQVEAAGDALSRDHSGVAPALRELATRGSKALAEERLEDAVEAYEQLADLMFESGVYL